MIRCLLLAALSLAALTAQSSREIDHVLRRYAAFGFTGTVLVADNGKAIFVKGYGLADERSRRKNDEHTLFEVASLTKQFTAAAILKLQQDGRLSVTDTIQEHLPGVAEHSKQITIHHLLAHTSGVPRSNTKGRGKQLERAVTDYLDEGPVDPPGKKWGYWNGGYALLAGIVEQASGMSYVDYCKQQLFVPAGMDASGFTGDRDLDVKRAAFCEGRTAIEHPYGAYEWQYRGMGGAVCTVGDLLRWHLALLDDTVLDQSAREQLFHPHAARMAYGRDYAYGWYVGKAPDGSAMAWHGGDVRGFHCRFRRYPKRNACIAVLANSSGDPLAAIARHLEALLFGNKPTTGVPPEVVRTKARALQRLAGTYRNDAGAEFELTVKNKGLWLQSNNAAIARALTGNPNSRKASFAVMPVGKDKYASWTWQGAQPFEFESKGRRVVGVEANNVHYSRER